MATAQSPRPAPEPVEFDQASFVAAFDALAAQLPEETDRRMAALGLPTGLTSVGDDVALMLAAMRNALLRWRPVPKTLDRGEAQKLMDVVSEAIETGLRRVMSAYESYDAQSRALLGQSLRDWNSRRPSRRDTLTPAQKALFTDAPRVDTSHFTTTQDADGKLHIEFHVLPSPEDIAHEREDERKRRDRAERQRQQAEQQKGADA